MARAFIIVCAGCLSLAAVLLPVPASAQAPAYFTQWGTLGSGDGQFNAPYAVAVDAGGNVYVADMLNNRIQKFSSVGTYLTQWGTFGTGDGQFNHPYGVAVDDDGNVYVADMLNSRIQKFSSSGTYLTQWGAGAPFGVAVDVSGNVYVADTYNDRILVFTSDGAGIAQWGTSGSGAGELSLPTSVAADAVGNVYVMDHGNHRIQKFSSRGVYLAQWGSLGSGNGQFKSPRGVAVDGSGSVYVADSQNNRIQQFSSSGAYVTQWGGQGSGFSNPLGVAVARVGSVYVADTDNHRIQVFGSPLAVTSTLLVSAPNPSVTGQPIALTATVTPDTATGAVVFYDGAVALGTATVTSGVATITVSSLLAAIHSLTAVYLGDKGHGPSASAALIQAVNAAGTSTIVSSSSSPSLFGQAVSFTATVGVTPPGVGNPTGTVQFKINNADFGAPVALAGGRATSASTDALSVGPHQVQAFYSGDGNFVSSTSAVLAQTVGPSGPVIAAVRDVSNDQGGRVFVTWRCALDQSGLQVVTGYRIWRRVPSLALAVTTREESSDGLGSEAPRPDSTFQGISTVARDGSMTETFWEAIATLPSAQLVSYGYTAATTQDSIVGSNPYTAFFVQALTADPFVFYSSDPDSGYSVDNLSPAQPAPFAALYGPSSGVALHWGKSTEGDLRGYRLYRGTTPNFLPGPGNLVAAQPDTGFYDASGSLAFAYKLSAIDIHGNESRFALVTADGATGALASLLSAEVEGAVVRLRWMAAANPGLSATVYRRTAETNWMALGQVSADGTGIMAWNDAQVVLGRSYGYRLGVWDGASETFLGETWVEVSTLTFALEGVRPNPSRGEALTIHFSLPNDQPATLGLLDVTGRRIATHEVGSLGAGPHALDLREGRRLAPGLYLVRLTQGSNTRTTRVAVLR